MSIRIDGKNTTHHFNVDADVTVYVGSLPVTIIHAYVCRIKNGLFIQFYNLTSHYWINEKINIFKNKPLAKISTEAKKYIHCWNNNNNGIIMVGTYA